MTVSALGNHGVSRRNGGSSTGIGVASQSTSVSWTGMVASAAGDTVVIPLDTLGALHIDQGIFAQSSVPCDIQLTLSPRGMVDPGTPSTWANALWGNDQTIAPSDITEIPFIFTAIKITFSAPGEFYLGAH